jgi:hypothetical protein
MSYSTKQVANALGIKPQTLTMALWNNRVELPSKSPSGRYQWKLPDIEKASWALLHKPLDKDSLSRIKPETQTSVISLFELAKAIRPLILGEINESDIETLIKAGQIKPYKVVSGKPVFLIEQVGTIARRFTLRATA